MHSDPETCNRRTLRTASYLLGMTQEIPGLSTSPEDVCEICMAQAISNAGNGGGYPPPSQGSESNEADLRRKSELMIYVLTSSRLHLTTISQVSDTPEYNEP